MHYQQGDKENVSTSKARVLNLEAVKSVDHGIKFCLHCLVCSSRVTLAAQHSKPRLLL